MSSLWKTPSVSTDIAPTATTVESDKNTVTSPLDQQRKNKKKYNFAATQGSMGNGETFGV